MKIGIVGGGTVGHATARAFLEHVDEVRVYDRVKERATATFAATLCDSDLIFVCLPETNLDAFFDDTQVKRQPFNFVLKSTVPIGTTRRLQQQYNLPNLCHSPEFLTARCAVTDAQLPARNIIGVPQSVNYKGAPFILNDLYERRFPGVPILTCTSDESEAIKLAVNSFFAVKISYFNELRSLCDKLGMDWDRVLWGVLSDGRISHSHTKVPGPDGKRGFGGACLPKDIKMLIDCMFEAGLEEYMLTAARNRNILDRGDQP